MMNLIDHLPRNSYYSYAVANDEEHAKLLAEAGLLDRKEGGGKWAPAMQTFSAEVEMSLMIVNELKSLRHTMVALKSERQPPAPEYLPGPLTVIDRISATHYRERRQSKHDKLVARLLPHKTDRIG